MINARLPFLVDFLIYTLIFTMLCFLFFFGSSCFIFIFFFLFLFFFFTTLDHSVPFRDGGEKKERILETGTFSIYKIVPWSRLYL